MSPHNRNDSGSFWILKLHAKGYGGRALAELFDAVESRILRITRDDNIKHLTTNRYRRDIDWHKLSAFVLDQIGFESGDESSHWSNHPEINRFFTRRYNKKWFNEHRAKITASRKHQPAWRKNNRAHAHRRTAELSDTYILQLICGKTNLKSQDVPKEFVAAYRELVRLKREIKTHYENHERPESNAV